jgi:hypothetical protein
MYDWSEMPDFEPITRGNSWAPFIVAPLVAAAMYWFGHSTAAAVILVVGLSIATGIQLSTKIKRGFQGFAARMSLIVGGLLRWSLLAPFYLLMIAPLALIARLSGSDKLALMLTPNAPSYWEKPAKAAGYDHLY